MRVTFCNFNLNSFDPFRSYYLVARQQGRVQLDSDANEGQRIALQPSRLSLGIAASEDRFEPAKGETWLSRIWNSLSRGQ